MVSVLQAGNTSAAPFPWSGQMAPKMCAERVRWSHGSEAD